MKRYSEKNYSKLTWIEETVCKRITSEAWFATANRTMVYDSASALLTTRIRTWVNTFIIFTSQIQRAIRTNCTLWFTIRRYTYISLKTRTRGLTIDFSALTIRSARCWLTRISEIRLRFCKRIQYHFSSSRYNFSQIEFLNLSYVL